MLSKKNYYLFLYHKMQLHNEKNINNIFPDELSLAHSKKPGK